jgi:RND family efflux transporter MFP subunit
LAVIGVAAFIVVMIGQIKEEKVRLDQKKRAAMKKEVPPVKVITLTLVPHRLKDRIDLPAEVEAAEEVIVKAEVSGQVMDIRAREGARLKKGQVLLSLDDRDYRSRLARIQANHRLAEREYQRHAKLTRSNATSRAKLDNIEAQLKALEAQLEEARLALSRTRIAAPISCVLNDIMAEKGDFVGVGEPVAQILQVDQVTVTVGVPESDVAAIFDLEEAEVVLDALDDRRVTGKKVFLSRKPRTLARLYDLELSVPNPDGRILPGMFARVTLVKKVYEQALTIPLYAMITQGDEQFVYVEEEGRARKRHVEPGILANWQVQVTSGLKTGDRVIVVGHRLVDEGQPLEIIRNVQDAGEILNL